MRLFLWVSLLLLLTVSACSTSPSCATASCPSTVHFQGSLRFRSANDSLDVTVCKNGSCARGTVSQSACSVSGLIDATCRISIDGTGNGTLSVDFLASAKEDLKDGDLYTVRVLRGQTNESLVDVTKPVSYKTTRPNGPECEPSCRSADMS